MLYGLTLSHPRAIFAFVLGSLAVVTVVGVLFDWYFRSLTWRDTPPNPVAYGLRRLFSILVAAAREATGPSLGYVLLGLLGVALLAVALPHGSLQSSVQHDNPLAPLVMVAVAIPAYAPPMTVMGQLGSMFQHGNSIGAAFVLLTLGAGVNLGIIVWIVRQYGAGRAAAWGSMILATVLGIAYGLEKPLYPREIDAADHTHAFDIYTLPFAEGSGNLPSMVWYQLRQNLQIHELAGLIAWGAVLVVGGGLRVLDRSWNVETWLEKKGPEIDYSERPWHQRPIPTPVLGLTALAGLVALSIVGCYAYYPPPEEVFEELRIVRTEVLQAANSGQCEHALRWIEVWEDWTRRLEVGLFLRKWELSEDHRRKAHVMREHLDRLEHELEDGDLDEIKRQATKVDRAHTQLRSAFLDQR